MMLAEVSSDFIGTMIGAAGGVGFSVWYGWYITTKTIPQLVSEFRAEAKENREARASEIKMLEGSIRDLTTAVGHNK